MRNDDSTGPVSTEPDKKTADTNTTTTSVNDTTEETKLDTHPVNSNIDDSPANNALNNITPSADSEQEMTPTNHTNLSDANNTNDSSQRKRTYGGKRSKKNSVPKNNAPKNAPQIISYANYSELSTKNNERIICFSGYRNI